MKLLIFSILILAAITTSLPALSQEENEETSYEAEDIEFPEPAVPQEAKAEEVTPKASPPPEASNLVAGGFRPKHYFEPYFTYGQGEDKGEFHFKESGTNTVTLNEATWAGFGLGGRLAFAALEGLALGAEANYTRFSIDIDDDNVGVNSLGYGLYAGYHFEFPLRLYGTYFLSNSFSSDAGTISGKGFKVGVSYYSLLPVSLNLEYLMLKNDEAEFKDLDVNSYESDFSGVLLSIGYRFDFSL